LDAVTEIPHNKRQHKHHHRARGIGGRKFPWRVGSASRGGMFCTYETSF
jgi:hypothetical protein